MTKMRKKNRPCHNARTSRTGCDNRQCDLAGPRHCTGPCERPCSIEMAWISRARRHSDSERIFGQSLRAHLHCEEESFFEMVQRELPADALDAAGAEIAQRHPTLEQPPWQIP